MSLPDECGFCERVLDDGEELTPIYVGDPPESQPQTSRGLAEIDRRVNGVNDAGFDQIEVFGYPIDEIMAILDAVERSDVIDIETKRAVEKVQSVSGQVKALVETTVDSSNVGAAVTVSPLPKSDPEPDIEVCRFCRESFTEGSDDESDRDQSNNSNLDQ